ncbi:hypothetical protein CLPUN_20000 [Clostridium puniceum]|uniref:Uncharacterized protein n=1 Tax=Clostridium puniceum TaxID=29367 RepID=A0A1S8TK83_9CLOT|nr:hypothetical protein CLPUN_20000 [Clostridium puniceum]
MKKFINILINNKNLKKVSILTVILLLILIVFFFHATSDLPFIYSQF